MTLQNHGSKLALACALLFVGGCERHMVVDEGGGNAGASAGAAGEAGEAGDGAAGEAGEAGSAGDGSAGSGGGEAGSAGGDGVGGQFGDQPAVTTRWTGNDEACPDEPVYTGACEVEGLVCGYYGSEDGDPENTQYSECACHMACTADGTEMRWECYGNSGGRLDLCPAEQPEEDSSCFGLKGVQCYYPVGVACGCPRDESDSTWHCEYERLPAPEHPTVVDEDVVVSEMTDEERAAWCAWYAPAEAIEPGFPAPPEREPTEDGFYPDTGCVTTQFYGCGTLQPSGLPASACEDNLALSTCTATVRELNDCVLTARGEGPAPNGCARYLDTAGCSGTLVNGGSSLESPEPGFGDACLVRVE